MVRSVFSKLANGRQLSIQESDAEERAVGLVQSTTPSISLSMPSTIIVFVLLAVSCILVSCSEPPPSRIDLLRFFMGFGPEVNAVQKVSFNPEAGLRFREQYEKKYGLRGQLLIDRFGQGIAMQGPSVVDVDQLLDVPHKNKTKHYRTQDFNLPKSRGKNKKGITIEVQLSTASPEDSKP